MKNIEFSHNNGQIGRKGTIAVSLPNKDVLVSMFDNLEDTLHIEMGVTTLHPKEQFVKSIGREEALKRLNKETASLDNIKVLHNQRAIYNFVSVVELNAPQKTQTYVSFGLSIHPRSDNVRLEYAFFGDM